MLDRDKIFKALDHFRTLQETSLDPDVIAKSKKTADEIEHRAEKAGLLGVFKKSSERGA
jgi:hypothetical protein